jgi:signal transduction histidine kinase
VSRQPAIDDAISLSRLLSPKDLEEVARSFAELHGVPVGIRDTEGTLSIAVNIGTEPGTGVRLRRPILHDGETLGELQIGPYLPGAISDAASEQLATAILRLLSTLIHANYTRYMTAAVHVAAIDDAYAELTAKNERLAEALERFQEVDRLKSNFLATVSHELRTPLTSVIGYSEMLLEGLAGPINGEQRDYVQTILAKADQLLQLITGILDVSQIESGVVRIVQEPVEVAELVGAVVGAFEQEAGKQGVTLARVAPPDLPRVLGDAKKIRQILGQLVANAIKFTRRGGAVALELAVGPMAAMPRPGDGRLGLRIAVTDSGIGISPEKQAHIFEPFFQVDSSSTREYGGTGLGLTLVKSYAEAHGGKVWVESELGRGSRFTVSLPVVPEDLDAYRATRTSG